MSKDRENIPRANMLMGSMRSMGYSFESAVADVIDNSISANCKNVILFFPLKSYDTLAVGILDDGKGMSSDELFEAMRYGSDSKEERQETDLGRFRTWNEIRINVTMPNINSCQQTGGLSTCF